MDGIRRFYSSFKDLINIIITLSGVASVVVPIALNFLALLANLEKSNETMSYILREEMVEQKKGSPEGSKFSIWESDAGSLYYYDEADKSFYNASENKVDHTWGYVARDGRFYNCGERKN